MDAEGPTLTDDAVKEDAGILGDVIVFDKEFLEFVNDEEGAGDGLFATSLFVTGNVLYSKFAEHVATALELLVDTLEDAEAELAITLDGDDFGVGELVGGVALEFDALFEVDEVEFDVIRICCECEIGDDDVEEGGLPGPGLAGEEGVLAGAFADGEVLQLGGSGATDGDLELVRRIERPKIVGLGADLAEGDLDAV